MLDERGLIRKTLKEAILCNTLKEAMNVFSLSPERNILCLIIINSGH